MNVLIRKTVSGTEYWNTKAKRILFVPNGKKPDFEVTESPKSMIGGSDHSADNDGINLDDLNADELSSFAKQNGINVPGNMKKLETIRKFIADQLADESK